MSTVKKTRKFQDTSYYDGPIGSEGYTLLPFRFHEINQNTELIVNEMGDFLFAPKGTSRNIAYHKVDKSDPIYPDLLSNYIISETPIPALIDVMAARYRTKKGFLDNFTALHIMVITLRCDHSCHYCQVSRQTENKTKYDMSKKDINDSLRLIFSSPSKFITIEFQGGEPLLAFDKVKYCVEKALEMNKSEGKDINFVICTNLSTIDEDILYYCKDNNILISTSYDGPAFIHDINRPFSKGSSHETVLKGIDLCRKIIGDDNVSVLMTTTNLTLDYPIEIIDDYMKHGFRNIFLRPISPYGFATKSPKKNKYEVERFLEFYKTAFDHIIQINLNGKKMTEDYATIILTKILTPFPTGYVDLQSPAGLISGVVVYNYDGKVFASDEARMLAEMNDYTFQIGHVTDTYIDLFGGQKAMDISQYSTNESLPGCSECGFQTYCGADPVFNHSTQQDMVGHRPTSSFCTRNMEIIRFLFEKFLNEPILETVFDSWVYKYDIKL